MTRTVKTAAERATEALQAAQRRVTRAEAALKVARDRVQVLEADHRNAVARRDYLALDPELPKEQQTGEQA